MKIITWNLNGLRSLKNNLHRLIDELNADVYCFQETKLSRNQVEECIAFILDYCSFFTFPTLKSGYSGVVTYCRESCRPFDAQESLILHNQRLRASLSFTETQLKHLESEGRTMITKHCLDTDDGALNLFVINVYCPCGNTENTERLAFKLDFYNLLERKAIDLLECEGERNHVLIVGDINTAHQRVDHCDPDDDFDENPCRLWLDTLFNSSNKVTFVDVFRYLHPDAKEAYTCWNTRVNARETNYGTRIDYCICDSGFINYIEDCLILNEVTGSDHCPVLVNLKNVNARKSPNYPELCTKLWPEFGCGKKQMKMTDFVVKRSKSEVNSIIESQQSSKKPKNVSIINFFSKQPKEEPTVAVTSERNTAVQQNGNGTEKTEVALQWKSVLKGPPKPPLCKTHGVPCVLRTVTKQGPNRGKQFFICSRPIGSREDPKSQCNFFQWATK